METGGWQVEHSLGYMLQPCALPLEGADSPQLPVYRAMLLFSSRRRCPLNVRGWVEGMTLGAPSNVPKS